MEMALDLAQHIFSRTMEEYRPEAKKCDWSGAATQESIRVVGRRSCYSCPVGCRKIYSSVEGHTLEGPAVESVMSSKRRLV